MISFNAIFVSLLFSFFMILLFWASKSLPQERWQFIATVPKVKLFGGAWDGFNFTWYGALTALAFVFSCMLITALSYAVQVSLALVLSVLLALVVLSLVSARLVAQWVERVRGTHTIGGAVFVVTLATPLVIYLCDLALQMAIGHKAMSKSQVLALLCAISVGYCFGEGIGRVACISFGCCWGKRVDQLTGVQRWVFDRFHMVFHGATKKIAYASQMDGVPVIPIQSITAAVHFTIGSGALWFYLQGDFGLSLILSMAVTQGWRFASEFLRADYRGEGRITIYQWMALATILISVLYAHVLRDFSAVSLPDLRRGLMALWSPELLIGFQLLGLVIFRITGKSSVTRARLRLSVSD